MPPPFAVPLEPVHIDYDQSVMQAYASFNATHADFPLDSLVPHLVREQARRSPSALAVSDGKSQLSYRDLDQRVDAAAAGLRAAGCPVQGIVAVIAGRGTGFIVTVLGILRAGAVYLPVDPRLPTARKHQMLERSGVSAMVTDEPARPEALELAAQLGSPPVLRLAALCAGDPCAGDPCPAPGGAGLADPGEAVGPQDAAYVIYTSGSTGLPKGAAVHHQGMLNHLWAKITDLGIGPADRLAQNSPQSFDISVWQMLAPLLAGGSVHVLADEVGNDPCELAAAVAERQITMLEVVPSMLRVVTDVFGGDPRNPFSRLRAMVVTGEELLPQLARDWFALNPAVPLVNVYGPTECSDDVSHCHFTAAPSGAAHLPIGAPVANTQLWVVAPGDQPGRYRLCGPGEQGELWVTGTGVGLGYVNDHDRTRQAFFADPFHPGGRLYRTGDAVVLGADGLLTYLGRTDRQVKLRGHRIELSEIESALARHEQVSACAVVLAARPGGRRAVARERLTGSDTGPSGKILVAYVVSDASEHALRCWLARQLPAHMVPDKIIALDALPLTRNGKTDYQSLPAPGTGRPALDTPYTPATGPAQTAVSQSWSQALGIVAVGADDDFFALGGDSLLAMVIASELNRRFQTALKVRDVLRSRTPRRLAALIAQHCGGTGEGRAAAGLDPSTGRYPLSVHQQGVWFQWKLAPDNAYYNYQGSWSLRGPADTGTLQEAWRRLLACHPVLLCRFVEKDGQPFLEYPWHAPRPLEVRDLSGEPPDAARARFRAEALALAGRPLDLSADELVAARLYRFGRDRHELLLTTHEILLDGWATSVLTGELAHHYEAARTGTPADPPPAPGMDDFARFLAFQAREIRPALLAGQRQHWREVLSGSLPVLSLAADRPRPATPTFRGGSCATVLSSELTAALQAVSRRHAVTLFTTLLAGYAIMLARYSGQDELIIGVPMANRHAAELRATVGFLINMLPVRVRLDWDRTAADFLRELGGQVAEALANCEYPFPWMLTDARVTRDTAVSPVFQTMFNMLNYPSAPPGPGGLRIEFSELETGFTKYEMSLYAQPGADGDLYLQISFHHDLFDPSTAQRMLDGLAAACADLARDDGITLHEVSVMDAAQLSLILNVGDHH